MLCMRQIERLVQNQFYSRLVKRILANGRCHDPSILRRLLEPRAAAPAALGLALQRLLEFSWGSSLEATRMIKQLLNLQEAEVFIAPLPDFKPSRISKDFDAFPRGIFAQDTSEISAAALAVVVRGLHQWLERQGEHNPLLSSKVASTASSTLITRAHQIMDAAIASLQQHLESFDGSTMARLDARIILWQLEEFDELSARLDLETLRRRHPEIAPSGERALLSSVA